MESFTPRSLISGRVEAKRGREREAAFHAAAEVLGTERIALIHSSHKGVVWYLAAPAADLASHPNCATPLAAALPGARGHEGDGAYTTSLSGLLHAVIVKNGPNLHSFVGSADMMKRFIALEEAKATHSCAGAGMLWQSASELLERREVRLGAVITGSGLLVALLAAGVWLWAAYGVSRLDELRENLHKDQLTAWATAVSSFQPQGYPKALLNLQKAVEQAAREKGVLVQFEHKDDRATWTLDVNRRIVTGVSR